MNVNLEPALSSHSVTTGKNRFYVLDLLRLLAALSVVFYHYSIYVDKNSTPFLVNICALGYLGVNFFFMLSGFVIMASAENRRASEFIVARAQRLYPAFIACLLITFATVCLMQGQALPYKQVLLNATLLNDYLKVPNIDGVYWTLQAEIKFYGCIFVLMCLRLLHHWRYWVPAWCACAILFHFIRQPFFMGWFINPEYSFYFIGGVSAYLIYKYPYQKFMQVIFLLAMIFSIIKSQGQIKNFISHPAEGTNLGVQIVIAIFYIFFYLLAKGRMNLKSVPWWWIYLGAVSYPLYLLHNRGGKAVIEHYISHTNPYFLLAIVVFALLLISLCVHLFIEKPINRLIKKTKEKK